MSQLTEQSTSIRAVAARIGAVVAVVAVGLVLYGTYGDPTASNSQKSSVLAVVAITLVGTALVFGLLVPAGLRAIAARSATASRWTLGHTITGMLLIPGLVRE